VGCSVIFQEEKEEGGDLSKKEKTEVFSPLIRDKDGWGEEEENQREKASL